MKVIVVGDPELVAEVGEEILNQKSRYLHKFVIDMDLAQLYPSIIQALNMSEDTLKFQIVIPDTNELDGKTEDRSREFVQDYTSGDIIGFGKRYFNAPDITDMVKYIQSREKQAV